jgi:hypothetical protein
MGTTLKVLISLAVAFFGSLLTSATIIKSVALYHLYIVHRYVQPGDEFKPVFGDYIVMAAIFGSLLFSPILYAVCYRLLSRKVLKGN